MNGENRRHALERVHEVGDSLRESISAPDLSAQILDAVERDRPFLTERSRRCVWIGRGACACSLMAVAAAVVIVHNASPELAEFGQEPGVLTRVVESTEVQTSEGVRTLRFGLDTIASQRPAAAAFTREACRRCDCPERGSVTSAKLLALTPSDPGELRGFGVVFVSSEPVQLSTAAQSSFGSLGSLRVPSFEGPLTAWPLASRASDGLFVHLEPFITGTPAGDTTIPR